MSGRTRGVVAAGHALTAEAGADMLRQGGNAFDAVTAAAFASFICEPVLTSGGGGGFLNAYRRETGESLLFDFFVNMPGLGNPLETSGDHFFPILVNFGSSEQEFHVGPGSVAVPGNLTGLNHLHRRFGDLPWKVVLEPAIRLAREGVILNSHQAYLVHLLAPILLFGAEGRAIFSPEGDLLEAGDRLYMKDFAATLEFLSRHGASSFYTGSMAERTVETLQANGGLLTREDLNKYHVIEREPVRFTYRGYTILTNPPPSAGGCLIALALKIMEGIDLAPEGFLASETLNAKVAAMQLINAVRAQGYDEEIHHDGRLVSTLLTPERIASYQRQLKALLDGGVLSLEDIPFPGGSGSTTQISVLDGRGNAASLTSSNGENSGIYIPETGIMLNNMLGEEDLNPNGFHGQQAGRRLSSMMSPTIVLQGRDPVLVLGSGGSNRIRSAILQSIMNLVDFGKDAVEAVNAPRVHWERGTLNIEPGIDAPIAAHLSAMEDRVYWKETNLFFGGVHAVMWDRETDRLSGGGDHRRGGAVVEVDGENTGRR